ncbi:ABC transporter permease [Lamprobacter modestohalophilus]|uniref:ABC transporter permease n=1 Tax=Lamprobacter modestohalophilus TaxID=1064514 RepID=UPI002ADEBF27|nr:ABC transporter permease [Lamprobacter modestohalophilus]MEA1051480.1 ABC transporter permease [Lamprobacter modestohalophilus]
MIRQHWYLVQQLARYEVISRYKGSLLGLLWMLVNPLMMLAVYGFVFTLVFNARWPGLIETDQTGFVLVLFSGLIVFSFASEAWTRAPSLLRENPSYVKKVIFPLYVLPIVALAPPLFQAVVSSAILLLGYLILIGPPPAAALLLPLVALIYVVVVLGVSYLLMTLGTFVPDLRHAVGTLMTVLLFVSPVFYPLAAIPAPLQPIVALNPLSFFLETTRALLFDGTPPRFHLWLIAFLGATLCLALGLLAFRKARDAFSDVL